MRKKKIENVTRFVPIVDINSFFGVSIITDVDGGGNRCGVIIVLFINLTVGYALKYAAKPPAPLTKEQKKIQTKF